MISRMTDRSANVFGVAVIANPTCRLNGSGPKASSYNNNGEQVNNRNKKCEL